MVPHDRRSLLASLGVVALAGCSAGGGRDDGQTDDGTAEDATSVDGATDDGSDGEDRPDTPTLRLSVAEEVPIDGPVRVHPGPLARLLERAAERDGPVRTHDGMALEGKTPVLPDVETARLAGDAVDDGAYALDFDGGPRYEWLFGATSVEDPPADAEVVEVADLPADRRALALEAIHDGRPRAYPETPLGTWARTEFVGGYVRHEGTVYRGRELEQTDAAFFATEAWYVGTATPTDGATDAPRLLLDPLPDEARRVVDDLLASWAEELDPAEASVADLDDPARAALAETDWVLAHVAAFDLTTG
ncbi:hypothetical protein [Halobaculum sp. EA56]|uniref:hypothetical protein n=1 Tax=Halobaculum sp. EA56 TaxID=3421648 RepID=UPI003EB72690